MSKYFKRMRPLLGTFVEIGAPISDPHAEDAVNAAFEVVSRAHELLSFHDPKSELSILNKSENVEVELSPFTVCVLRLARAMTVASRGLFNCTVGGQLVRIGVLPDHGGPDAIDVGSADDLSIRGNRVKLNRPVRITLDGIAKGFAVDMAIKAMKRVGVAGGWVNAGGDLRVFGALELEIHRREFNDRILPLGVLRNIALATSTVQKKYDDRYPGQIVSGLGESPFEGTWSVTAPSAWLADALTKVASLVAPTERSNMIDHLGGRMVGTVHSPQWLH